MYSDLHLYIDLDWETFIEEPASYLKSIYHVVEFAEIHQLQIYYSTDQLVEFIKNAGDLTENFSQSYANGLDEILKNANGLSHHNFVFEVQYNAEQTNLKYTNLLFSAIVSHDDIAVLKNKIGINGTYLLVRSNSDFEKLDIKFIDRLKHIREWIFDKKGAKRVFNLSKKHGENGKGNWSDASRLLCSRAQAEELLKNAIADFKQRPDRLFNFDPLHGTYIEFFSEGVQNQWHGFHLEKKDWKRVPASILKYF